MEIIVGTAGHIDHGKTALIKALTGVDADRLPEEKERGITIDIGFAQKQIDEVRFGFVDVPGHERFVKNMLAGVSGIDFVILVVAADEGVMPQTREHFEICRLLGVGRGLVVLTKLDLVDKETLELAQIDVSELVAGSFLENAAVIEVSTRTGEGLGALNDALLETARSVTRTADVHVARLPVDRVFTVKGFGTVVTGTLGSGEISTGDEMELVPDGIRVRVRGLQTHGETGQTVGRGRRVAVNLAGVDRDEVQRGMTLSEKGILRATQIADAKVEVLAGSAQTLRSRQRVRVHIGTKEALARVSVLNESGFIVPGSSDLVQIRFESAVVVLPGERFILRAYSPQTTIAGGCVIDNLSEKHRKREFALVRERLLEAESVLDRPAEMLVDCIERRGSKGLDFAGMQARTGLRASIVRGALDASVRDETIADCGEQYISKIEFEIFSTRTIDAVTVFHRREPLGIGQSLDVLRETVFARASPQIARAVIAELTATGVLLIENDKIRLASHKGQLSTEEAEATAILMSRYTAAGYEVPRLEDALNDAILGSKLDRPQIRTVFRLLVESGELIKVTDEFYFSRVSISLLADKLRQRASKSGDSSIDVAKFKELAGVSRKYAIPLLEYFDRAKVTIRSGDKRIILL